MRPSTAFGGGFQKLVCNMFSSILVLYQWLNHVLDLVNKYKNMQFSSIPSVKIYAYFDSAVC